MDMKKSYNAYGSKPLDLELTSRILAADAISRNVEIEQDFGQMLTDFLPAVSGESVFSGFSHYSELRCNISRVGSNACNKALSKSGKCKGGYQRMSIKVIRMDSALDFRWYFKPLWNFYIA